MDVRSAGLAGLVLPILGSCATTAEAELHARRYLERVIEAEKRARPDDAMYYESLAGGPSFLELHARRIEVLTERVAELRSMKLARFSPVIGIIPSTAVQAEVVDVPGSNVPLVILSSGMVDFLVSCVSVSIRTVDFQGEHSDSETGISAEEVDYMLQLVVHHMFREGPYPLPATSQTDLELSVPVLFALDLFLVAHEYAHVALKHDDDAATSWHREIEADLWAYDVVKDSFSDAPWTWLAPAFYMALQDMFDDAAKIGRGVSPEEKRDGSPHELAGRILEVVRAGGQPVPNFIFAGVHPPTWIRRDYLMDQATSDFLESGREPSVLEKYMLAMMGGHEKLWTEAQIRLIDIFSE